MSKITLTRTNQALPANLDAARALLFESLKGMGEKADRSWKRFWGRMVKMEPGELAEVEVRIPRNPKFHRKFFALLNVGFDAWEPARKRKTYRGIPMLKNFERFRHDITILAGFYEQTFDLKGRMVLEAKSISFSNMDDAQFEEVYSAVTDVLLREVLTTYKGRAELDEVVERIMGFTA